MSFSCKKCDQTFSTEKRLANHKSNKTPCDSVCPHCNKACGSRRKYIYHMTTRHSNVKQDVKRNDETRINGEIISEPVFSPFYDGVEQENYGTLYICRPREFVRLNELTYKIGKTERYFNRRMHQYPSGTQVIAIVMTPDIHNAELEVIKHFKLLFQHMPTYGAEYFAGDITQMKRVMNEIVDKIINREPV